MSTKINLTYCGMDGAGATVKEAKADAARKIETLIAELGRAPHLYLMQIDAWTALVARDANGWGYKIISTPDQPLAQGMVYMNSFGNDQDATLRACAYSLLQNAWSQDVVNDELWLGSRVVNLPSAARDKSLSSNLLSWFSWQRDYKRLRDSGLSDTEAHKQARSTPH
jgi:hypothetical protein